MAVELVETLKEIAADKRVTVRRGGEPKADGKCVVYWLQKAQRALDNPALEVAIGCGNALGLPVVAYFSVIPNYPNANLRHYRFLQQGLHDIAEGMEERGVGFVVRRPTDSHPTDKDLSVGTPVRDTLEKFLDEVGAAMVVGDENVCREPERWRATLAKKLRVPFFTVDADVVVPSEIFGRAFVLLHHFRSKLHAQLDEFLVPVKKVNVKHEWKHRVRSYSLKLDITERFDKLDRSVGPVDTLEGGTKAGLKRLKEFTETQLKDYDERRNQPEDRGTSQMSAYLHYGHLSPITIALAVKDAVARGKATKVVADKYLDELIGWRELSVLFCKYNPNYDNWECAEPWARKTLLAHAGDKRPWTYTLAQLEKAETHDELWNASQRQMVRDGWMHNSMRMYWAKKILEWSPSAEKAFAWAVELNDKYELDGRDSNGYSGIAWAIVGKHDRPWFDRPVFGMVRYMSGESTGKKFDSKRYMALYPA